VSTRALLDGFRRGFPAGYTALTREGEADGDTGLDFGIHKLVPGPWTETTEKETVRVLLDGRARLEWSGGEGQTRAEASRRSLFDESPTALHVPAGATVQIESEGETEWAVARVGNATRFAPRLFRPEDIAPEYRGHGLVQGACLRNVRLIFDDGIRPEANLVIGEVVNYPGRWSSYPPHTHPQPEIYHYRFALPQGYGHAELGERAQGEERRYPEDPGRGHARPGLRAGIRDVLPVDRAAPPREPVPGLHVRGGPSLGPRPGTAGLAAERGAGGRAVKARRPMGRDRVGGR
jgi:5-deoxy-glucuronate isomerase